MNIAPMNVHGWNFEFDNSQLVISAEDNSQQLRLNARAAFSLLGYLYQYRDDLRDAAGQEEDEQVERLKADPDSAHEVDIAQSE